MTTLFLATRNRHKVEEIRAVLGPGFRHLSVADFPNAPPVIEDADTFAANATKKAVKLAAWLSVSGDPARRLAVPEEPSAEEEVFVLADDSGLEVDALGGAPGVHSARFAAMDSGRQSNSADDENNAKLLRLLAPVPAAGRTARFRCAIALTPVLRVSPPPPPLVLEDQLRARTELYLGVCRGRIGSEPRGDKGFGYDPLFIPEGYSCTLAELGEPIKNQISHRARALAKLRRRWQAGP